MSNSTSINETPKVKSALNVMRKEDMHGQLYFWTKETWEGNIPDDQSELQLSLDAVCAVLRHRFCKRNPEKFEEEFIRLLKLAQAAFSSEYAQINQGNKNLEAYKDELLKNEGPVIKDEYLKELAIAALKASAIILFVTIAVRSALYFFEKHGFIEAINTEGHTAKSLLVSLKWDSKYSIMHFGVFLISCMWGIWLSFAVRHLEFRFEQLQHPESDFMRPWSR